nr:putative oxidoreductase [Quercus suber]
MFCPARKLTMLHHKIYGHHLCEEVRGHSLGSSIGLDDLWEMTRARHRNASKQVLAADANNIVIGLVRNKSNTDAKIVAELGKLNNVHILQADVQKYADLAVSHRCFPKSKTRADSSRGRRGYSSRNRKDYWGHSGLHHRQCCNSRHLVCFQEPGHRVSRPPLNMWPKYSLFLTRNSAREPEKLEEDFLHTFRVNVMGNVHLFNLFVPLVLKGQTKKVIHIGSANSVLDLVAKQDMFILTPYAASKSAMNIVVAKFSAFYRQQGVLFLSVAPGVVDTEYYRDGDMTDEIMTNMNDTAAKFKQYAPHFEGLQTPVEAARQVLEVVERSSIKRGDAGQFVSQFGNQQWL